MWVITVCPVGDLRADDVGDVLPLPVDPVQVQADLEPQRAQDKVTTRPDTRAYPSSRRVHYIGQIS